MDSVGRKAKKKVRRYRKGSGLENLKEEEVSEYSDLYLYTFPFLHLSLILVKTSQNLFVRTQRES